jgi:hypothetical protein
VNKRGDKCYEVVLRCYVAFTVNVEHFKEEKLLLKIQFHTVKILLEALFEKRKDIF